MRKTFLQRLQKVRCHDILHVFLFLFAIIPALVYKVSHKPLWVVSECMDEARDNGYWFFKYTRETHPEQDIVYAINKHCNDYQKVAVLGKTVQYGSFLHWILYLACSVKISSQKSGRPNDAVCYILDKMKILGKKEVFLQHGIIKDDIPYIHAGNANFCLFTTSTKRETEYVRTNFGFPDSVVRQLGLCRFDDLKDESDGDMILVMPTWRQWIANPDSKTADIESFKEFHDTEYYKKWDEFITLPDIFELLDIYGKHLVFYPHRHMQQYAGEFDIPYHTVQIGKFPEMDVHDLLKRASLLITDYSSVAMDFAYMGKPVIYYQFDYDKFRENHLYEGYYDYHKDGFGPVVKNIEEMIAALETFFEKGENAEYRKRAENFFDLKDCNNCMRTYLAVKELEGI